MQWHPIDTAPIDREILLLNDLGDKGRVIVHAIWWINERSPKHSWWMCPIRNCLIAENPTHWCEFSYPQKEEDEKE